MTKLHSEKLSAEKKAFIEELFETLPVKERVISGDLHHRARLLHQIILPAYIMRNFSSNEFNSDYYDVIFTNLIESEALLILGFRNAGISSLRSAFESATKFLYYEYHPIELVLHRDSNHLLTSTEYRNFLYSFPGLQELSFLQKSVLETLWSELCKYVHCDLRVVETLSVVADISSFLELEEAQFQRYIQMIKHVVKLLVSVFFAIDPLWAKDIEKVYYDAILEAFTISERKEVRTLLTIA